MREDIAPFRKCEENGRKILWLYGEENNHKIIKKNEIQIILEAMAEGWDIDIRYTVISGGLPIRENDWRFGTYNKLDTNLVITISGSVRIKDCDIIGDVNCISVIFEERVDFSRTTFKGIACFDRAKISPSGLL